MKSDVFSLLSEQVRSALVKMGLSKPTELETKAIPLTLKGDNVLLIAPTGSGKKLAS